MGWSLALQTREGYFGAHRATTGALPPLATAALAEAGFVVATPSKSNPFNFLDNIQRNGDALIAPEGSR